MTLNNLSDNKNYFSMFENDIFDAWKGNELSSTNVTSNTFTVCSN